MNFLKIEQLKGDDDIEHFNNKCWITGQVNQIF